MNYDERIFIPRIGLARCRVKKVPLINVFGVTSHAYDWVEDENPYILLEGKGKILLENRNKLIQEHNKIKVWRTRK